MGDILKKAHTYASEEREPDGPMLASTPAFAMGDSVAMYASTVDPTTAVERPRSVSSKRPISGIFGWRRGIFI